VSFWFSTNIDIFEEVAKYRAARRLWAKIMRERFGAKDPASLRLRFWHVHIRREPYSPATSETIL